MKKWIVWMILPLFLTGCAAEETFETIADEQVAPVIAQQRQIYVELPDAAASPAVESDSGRIYLCGDYEIVIQTLEGGDLDGTLQTLTGFRRDDLTVMETWQEGCACYEFVFASAGETGDLVGRGMILDDGSYHYCLTVLAEAEKAEENQVYWEEMFMSFRLA